jgi:hypothetical protein
MKHYTNLMIISVKLYNATCDAKKYDITGKENY